MVRDYNTISITLRTTPVCYNTFYLLRKTPCSQCTQWARKMLRYFRITFTFKFCYIVQQQNDTR